ncbi:hypothetical protein HYPSUDRAFT_196592 [Hypholoma sublateritium FD-334 SS-4]|uniref:Elongator complex protein 5 n=1 Tax=Hypholoma sublateritium (strain FD-334 SS-4) TaxID=945553 RepID=A0A0D2PEM0_HYPSF|nr:hypothetical protein HYPSUDRAFT_196592 [Hypholoma sublateritium FD-334 SS-4]
MVLLPSILKNESQRHPLLVLQSSLAQSSLPILASILAQEPSVKGSTRHNLLFCLLYQPSSLTQAAASTEVHDWTDRIPGYGQSDYSDELLSIVENALAVPSQATTVIIDSIDTLLEDRESLSEAYKTLARVCEAVKKHPDARLVLHAHAPSRLLPLITQTGFSSALAHITVHPPALLTHLAAEFLMPPPPLSPAPKFWGVFIPVSERVHDTESLVFGPGGEGSGGAGEFVAEVVVREGGAGRKRGVERVLEGWATALGCPCELMELESIQPFAKRHTEHIPSAAPDPTQNLPFNLSLTSSQQESRAQVPLPYAHEGVPITSNAPGAIFYDPDSADDIDDDDPDEDLDI